jgi:Bacterial PH domain
VVAASVRLGIRPHASPGLPQADAILASCLAAVVGLWLALLILRTHLSIGAEGLADHRLFRVVRVPWPAIAGFEVSRPRGLWGGYCVSAVCSDGETVDLMSTRAYSRVPSARHVDELHRICWTLEETARRQAG